MDLTTLKAHIKMDKLDNYYIFTGPELEIMRIYLRQMKKVTGFDVKNLTCITEFAKNARARSALKNRSILVFYDDKEFMSSDTLQTLVTQNNTFSDDIVIFIYTTLDKRSKLYKRYQDHIVEFEHLKPDILIKYIQREVDLNDQTCRELIEVCEQDYSRILLEIDKIKQFVKNSAKDVSYNQAFHDLLKTGVIYKPAKDAVFDFVDAVLQNKPKLAFKLLKESYASGEATMVLLANLYNATKQLLQVQSYNGNGKISEVTGLTPFQVKLASGRKGRYSIGDLVYLMRLTRDVEKRIKTGEIEESIAVPYILVNLW